MHTGLSLSIFLKHVQLVKLFIFQEVYDTKGSGMVLMYRYDCGTIAPTCIAAHPGDPVFAVGVDHKLLILEVSSQRMI